ncbi:UTP--glucose-1-phosphate uridylyltransferase [Nocardiopsis suaedae]|uniref:UTP--glucose-1-phosphate uridylyltransferase n=1 Tax=Nocardiopsis suaedae TaxID=3018444 RepID=A0ABT4TSI3_9ACTN|nr:UTP--glucose-1-phosphate uridylyltransferase [Nocardiopsis suaedae]MDA2807638.1 UTP--glucose-1-phosphate uridylyltransferase [Nocardiopsis suaedae]
MPIPVLPGTTPTKAVIPAAGYGTRLLPVTKAVPKELLPIVDRPALQYVVEEAVASGLPDVLVVTGRNKSALEDYFDHAPELDGAAGASAAARLAGLGELREEVGLHFVRQGRMLGLGHAVLQARMHVGDEPFAVLLPDDLLSDDDPLLERMLRVREEHGGSVVALMEVPRERIPLYGCAAVDGAPEGGTVRVADLVEKPSADEAPSTLAVVGRYVLSPRVFAALEKIGPGLGGEVQLTDALRTMAADPGTWGPVHGVLMRGERYDTGDRAEYLRTVVRLAARHGELGPDFTAWLRDFVSDAAR